MNIPPGIVVVDATFLKDLKKPESVARIETAMRTAHLELAPSVPNVLEAINHPNPEIRVELLAALRRWASVRPLNPWPLDLLRLAGEALPAIEFNFGPDKIDELINKPESLAADHEKARTFLEDLRVRFAKPYEENRDAFQRALKDKGLKYAWADIGAFLASPDWSASENQKHLISVVWDLAGLRGQPPEPSVVVRSETWRLALEAFGAATFVRSIRPNKQANPPGFVDLLQLVYLSQHSRARILGKSQV